MQSKHLFLIIIAFVILLNLPVLAQDSGREQNAPGFISIISTRDSIAVLLDHRLIGFTPIVLQPISTGKHELQASPRHSTAWEQPAWRQNFEIAASETLFFRVEIPRQIYLNSQPFGASVLRENRIIGTTPFYYQSFDSTTSLLVLRKPGYLDYLIKLPELKNSSVQALLKENNEIKESQVQFTSLIQSRQKRKKMLTYSMLGLTVASGISAIYFKQQADDRYRDYQSASQPSEMNRLFDETQRLDNYTAVSYGLFQISFITSLYLLLFKK